MGVGSTIKIAILAEAAKAKAEMASVTKSAEGMASKLKGGVALAAGAAGVALGAMAVSAVAGARESAEIHRVLESQIKGMGAAAATAFGGATKFAEDYGKAIGKDDDDILKVVNKLSTFPAAFGKGTLGAEGMRRATQAAFDLEAAGVGSAESNIIGLGKAMDNPIKGLTALSKSGVSFTDEQKKQITQYTKQGDLAKAQAVLLQGIESNAKGAANAQADGLTRAKVALDGFAEGLASKLLPYLDRFGAWFTDVGIPTIERFGAWFGTNVAPVIGQAFEAAKSAGSAFIDVLSNPAVQAFAASIGTIVAGLKIYQGTMALIRAATVAWTAVQTALNVVMTANPIGLIVLAIAALIAGFVVAYKRSETFRDIVNGVWSSIKNAINAVIEWFTTTIPRIWESATAMWDGVVAGAQATWEAIKAAAAATLAAITATWEAIKAAAAAVWTAITSAAQATWTAITTAVQLFVAVIIARFNAFKAAMLAIWEAVKVAAVLVWDGIKAAIQAVVTALTFLFDGWKKVILALWTGIRVAAEAAWAGIKTAISTAITAAKTVVTSTIEGIKKLFSPSTLLNAGRQLIQGLIDGIGDRIEAAVQKVRDGVARIKGLLPGSPIKWGPLTSWNNGGAGKRLMDMLATGIRSGAPGVSAALSDGISASATVGIGAVDQAAGTGTARTVTIENLNVQIPGSFDLASPAERKAVAEALVREIQESLVAYEGGRR
ncbi:MAG: hypothetical protein IPK24_22485 [Kineosporiaceae bacterium]|nr:hypothetical protein [Kineosporiaceae bacterium]